MAPLKRPVKTIFIGLEKEQEETYSQFCDSGYIAKPKSSSQMFEIERGSSTFLSIS